MPKKPKFTKCTNCTNTTPSICPACAISALKLKELEKLEPQDGDFILVKDEATFDMLAPLMQEFPKALVFILAPGGLEKVSRADLEEALKWHPEPAKIITLSSD